jgi:hypothetical protein
MEEGRGKWEMGEGRGKVSKKEERIIYWIEGLYNVSRDIYKDSDLREELQSTYHRLPFA